ncbi:PucR family transcriptional regulator [Sphaerisporangium aureirubrum]|uniref:PucR family transcriptional regulator n=1 Tax=Sphaerisporangium aureirubrum TaxID=1544736 RepID=A0ABW1NP86_9ACTN
MGGFFRLLRDRADANARRAVETYTSQLADYRLMSADARSHASLFDFAVLLRRRTFELAEDNRPFSEDDLAHMAAMGKERGERGVSLASHRRVLLLHSTLTLREVQEAAEPDDLEALMMTLDWLGPHGTTAQSAYTRGYVAGQERLLPMAARVQLLAKALLAEEPTATEMVTGLGMAVPERYTVTVVRVSGRSIRRTEWPRDEVLEVLLKTHLMPLSWPVPEEFVALVPADDGVPATGRALSVAQDFAAAIGRPCSVGTATGRLDALAATFALARQVSEASPIENVPRRARTLADVFVELGAAQVPEADEWLHDVARRLASGPDLVTTLNVYYGCDMNRLRASAALHVHPRTLDYRLQRVRELTGLNPGSTRGILVLNTAVARLLAGAWPDAM